MGGKGFLPNLHAGITAACLTQLLSQRSALTGFQWGQVQQLAHGLCLRRANAAKGVTAQLLAGQANPEDNVSKLLLALLRLYKKGPAAGPGADAPAASAGGGGKSSSPEQLQAAYAAFKVVAERAGEVPGPDGYYLINHTASVILLNRDGVVVDRIPHGSSPQTRAARVRAHR